MPAVFTESKTRVGRRRSRRWFGPS